MLAEVFPKPTGVFSKVAKEFCKFSKFLLQPISNARRDTANGLQDTKNVRMLAKEFCKDTKDGRMHTKEFSNAGKKLRIPAKSPGMLANFLRKVGKVLRKLADVFSQKHSAVPKLGETGFMLTFFSRNISRKKSKAAFSFRNMHEEKSKDTFFVGKMHPPAVLRAFSLFVVHPSAKLHTFSAFVLKQRTSMRIPARSIDNNGTLQRPTAAGREAGTHRSEIAMRPSYEAVVSQAETRRKNLGRRNRGLSPVVPSLAL